MNHRKTSCTNVVGKTRISALLVLLALHILPGNADGQFLENSEIGFGMGLDHGGFGLRYNYQAFDKVGFFAGLGYNLVSVGYNLGTIATFAATKRINWNLIGMYGYNAALKVSTFNGTFKSMYYGPTIGIGIHWKSQRHVGRYWSSEILVPLRVHQVQDAIDALHALGYSTTALLPVAISVGYHVRLKSKNE